MGDEPNSLIVGLNINQSSELPSTISDRYSLQLLSLVPKDDKIQKQSKSCLNDLLFSLRNCMEFWKYMYAYFLS